MRNSPQTTYDGTRERKIRHIMEGMGAFSNRSDRDDCSNVNETPLRMVLVHTCAGKSESTNQGNTRGRLRLKTLKSRTDTYQTAIIRCPIVTSCSSLCPSEPKIKGGRAIKTTPRRL